MNDEIPEAPRAKITQFGDPQSDLTHRPASTSNNAAVMAFISGVGVPVFVFWFHREASLLAIVASIAGIVLGRKGMNAVDSGETSEGRGIAKAGFIAGIIGVVAAVLVVAIFVAYLISLPSNSDPFR